MKAHWKMFIYGGLLKLLGDLTALVGPISIIKIVEYIDVNLNASTSMLTQSSRVNAINIGSEQQKAFGNLTASTTIPITHSTNFNDATNSMRIGSTNNNNYYLPLSSSSIEYQMSTESEQMMSAHSMINENTEIYYASWLEFIANGWIMAVLVLFATLLQGSLSQASTHIVNMIGIRIRSSLQGLVYRKTLLISSSCFIHNSVDGLNNASSDIESSNGCATNGSTSNGMDDENENNNMTNASETITTTKSTKNDSNDKDDKSTQLTGEQTFIDTGKITNLMSEDALNVMSFFWIAHYVWAIPLKVCVFLPIYLYMSL